MNAHEHVDSEETALVYQRAARSAGIKHTVVYGSPRAALFPGQTGYGGLDENNHRMLALALRAPENYSFFAAIDPDDPQKLQKLESLILKGAKGLKLYSGHTAYHRGGIDQPGMHPVYQFCEREKIPVVMHVNLAVYQQEFEEVLRRYPELKVVCPHFCLSTIRHDRFRAIMDKYPQLYTDMSFGFVDYAKEAFVRVSQSPQIYRDLIVRYQNRVLFGLDLVVNGESYKTEAWMRQMMQAYRDFLEKEEFYWEELPGQRLRGLQLDPVVLRKIYSENYRRIVGPFSD